MGLIAYAANEDADKPAPQSARSWISVLLCQLTFCLKWQKNICNTWPDFAHGYQRL